MPSKHLSKKQKTKTNKQKKKQYFTRSFPHFDSMKNVLEIANARQGGLQENYSVKVLIFRMMARA